MELRDRFVALRALPSYSGALTITSDFDIPNASKPNTPTPEARATTFDFNAKGSFIRNGLTNVLTLRNDQFSGNYHVNVEVNVRESVDPTGNL